jgi:hypothetical protein
VWRKFRKATVRFILPPSDELWPDRLIVEVCIRRKEPVESYPFRVARKCDLFADPSFSYIPIKQCLGRYAQSFGEDADIPQAHVALATFNTTDVAAI